jgi:precorrin-3B methylase
MDTAQIIGNFKTSWQLDSVITPRVNGVTDVIDGRGKK